MSKIDELLNKCASESTDSIEQLSKQEVKEMMKKFKRTRMTDRKVSIRKKVISIAAAAACLTVLAAVPNMNNTGKNISGNVSSETAVSKNRFYISASAAEIEEQDCISLKQSDTNGEVPFSGSCFFVHGENIKTISLYIDKGEFYKVDLSDMNKADGEGNYVIDSDGNYVQTTISYECVGDECSEDFDENVCYGFYFADDTFDKHYEENGGDIKQSFHDCYDDLNEAKMTVTVEYEDMTTESATYTLKSGKLEIDEETMEMTGNFAEDGAPYIYGVCIIPDKN